MDPKEIRELIELISRSNFASFELEGDGFKLKLVKEQPATQAGSPQAAPASPRLTNAPAAVANPSAAAVEQSLEPVEEDGTVRMCHHSSR